MDSSTPMAPDTPPASQDQASIWEDFMDIFYAPSRVFARRANGNFWIPMLVATLLIAGLTFANRNIMRPVFDAEYARNMAAAMKANPQLTPEMMSKGRDIAFAVAQYGSVIVIPIMILFMGFLTWLGAKFVDAKLSWNSALVIVAYATFPKILQQVVMSIQGLLIDSSKLNSLFAIEIGPGRFVDATSVSPILAAVYHRLDLFVLWGLVLIAIGVAVIGKVPKAKAWAFGIGLWVVTVLPGLFGAWRQM